MRQSRVFATSHHSNSWASVTNTYPLSKSKFDLDECIKPLIAVGRFSGIIPCGWSTWHSYKRTFRFTTFKVLITVLFACWSLIEAILQFYLTVKKGKGTNGALSYILNCHTAFVATLSTFVFLYFIRSSDKLYSLIERWRSVSLEAGFEEHRGLRFIGMFSILFMVPSLCTLTAFITELLRTYATAIVEKTGGSRLKALYNMSFMGWYLFIPYNPFFAIIVIAGLFLRSLVKIFGPALVIFFSQALSYQFKKLIERATNAKISAMYFVDLQHKDKLFWKDIVHKHECLCLLVKVANQFFSPLIFASTSLSIYTISTQLYRALTLGSKVALSPYLFSFSFAVEVIQYFFMISSASNVNTYAIKILDVLRKCPRELYSESWVSRHDHQVSEGQAIAFTGLGWYFITKRFILKVISAIFTIEIVLLESEHKK